MMLSAKPSNSERLLVIVVVSLNRFDFAAFLTRLRD
jgi:hypothetical protein